MITFQIVALAMNFLVATLVTVAAIILVHRLHKLGKAAVPRISLAKYTPHVLFIIFIINIIFTIALFFALFLLLRNMPTSSNTTSGFGAIITINTIPMSIALVLSITIFSFMVYIIYILSKSSH